MAHWAVPLLSPNSAQTSRQDRPCARRVAILAASTRTRGLPRCLPLARALRKPARTRSAIRLRSSSATAPKTVPVGLSGRRLGSRDEQRLMVVMRYFAVTGFVAEPPKLLFTVMFCGFTDHGKLPGVLPTAVVGQRADQRPS